MRNVCAIIISRHPRLGAISCKCYYAVESIKDTFSRTSSHGPARQAAARGANGQRPTVARAGLSGQLFDLASFLLMGLRG